MEDVSAEAAMRRGAPCELLATVGGRLRGLLGRRPDAAWHVLAPCRDVHTFGMAHPIDIAFIDEGGRVLWVQRHVGRNRRVRCRSAAAAIERFATGGRWLQPGDRVGLALQKIEGPGEPERKEAR